MRRLLCLLVLPAVLSACSVFGPDGDALVDLLVSLPTAEAQALDFEVSVAEQTLMRMDFDEVSPRQFNADRLTTAARSTAFSCTVSRNGAHTTGTLRLDLQADWAYDLHCAVQDSDPLGACMGCRGSKAVALDPALGLPSDVRLYLVWGGDPIDEPVLY